MDFSKLLVFDLETVPDAIYTGEDEFPPLPFHRVVAIGILLADIEHQSDGEYYVVKEIRCGGVQHSEEPELLSSFAAAFEKWQPRLVSFNGRGFDLPVLRFRSMKHAIVNRWLCQGNGRAGNYSYRYNSDWHCDLLDVLADYGATRSAGLKLDYFSQMLGLPGKPDMDGSAVHHLWERGERETIRNYCETDVLNTFMLYLRFHLYTGTLSPANYDRSVNGLHQLVCDRSAVNPMLESYVPILQQQTAAGLRNPPDINLDAPTT